MYMGHIISQLNTILYVIHFFTHKSRMQIYSIPILRKVIVTMRFQFVLAVNIENVIQSQSFSNK